MNLALIITAMNVKLIIIIAMFEYKSYVPG